MQRVSREGGLVSGWEVGVGIELQHVSLRYGKMTGIGVWGRWPCFAAVDFYFLNVQENHSVLSGSWQLNFMGCEGGIILRMVSRCRLAT